jgi:hypothetical protein
MLRNLLSRWRSSTSFGASWPASSSFGQAARRERVAAARVDFADALIDVHTEAAADALDRIAVARSLHELWNFRVEVFSRIAQRHDQAEAARRLAVLDRHFPKRPRRVPARRGEAGTGR